MFDRVARRYDLVNTVLSGGTDGGWRRRAARATGLPPGGSALDVACGTGKLTAELARIAGIEVGWSVSISARRCWRSQGVTTPRSSSSKATR